MNNNSSNSSTGEGNTKPPLALKKQISPAKRWSFTCFNVDQDNINNIIEVTNSSDSSSIIGYETCPETKKKHLQCYIEFKFKCRPKNLFKDNTIHWEPSKGNKMTNIQYCSKEKLEWTNFKIKKPLNKLACEGNFYKWQTEIIDILKGEPEDRKIYWFYGSGKAGKTTFMKYINRFYDYVIILGGKDADMKMGVINFKKMNNDCDPEIVIINIPKSFDSDYISYTGIENVKDMIFFSGKYEGGIVDGNNPFVFVFSNDPPDTTKLSEDRWMVYDIDNTEWDLDYSCD